MWAQSNRLNIVLKAQSRTEVFSWIEKADSLDRVVILMCAFSRDSPLGEGQGKTRDFTNNTFRRNFKPLIEGLKILLVNGASQPGVAEDSCLEKLFEGKTQLPRKR